MKPSTNATWPTRICVLQSSYEGSHSETKEHNDYECTPAYVLSDAVEKGEFTFKSVPIRKATAYSQIRELVRSQEYDVFFNLCDGALDEDRAGISVVEALESFNVPFTGADSENFEPTKIDMKMLAFYSGINVPAYAHILPSEEIETLCSHLAFPVIVKHTSGYNSVGMTRDSMCRSMAELIPEAERFMARFGECLVEEYIEGIEVTVLACEDPHLGQSRVFVPIEFKFPDGEFFKHFDLKWVDFDQTKCRPMVNEQLAEKCKQIGLDAFDGILNGIGYGRSDLRIDSSGKVYLLEINPNCGLFYPGKDGSADLILEYDEFTAADFARLMIEAAIVRNEKKLALIPPVKVSYSSANGHGYHVTALRRIAAGERIFADEGRPLRLVTKKFIERNWSKSDQVQFAQYAWPFSAQVFAIWPREHQNWRPLGHSCSPNLWFGEDHTLDVYARRDISIGEQLTMDYATFMSGQFMQPFNCTCGADQCRRRVSGNDYTTSSQLRDTYGTRVTDFVYQDWWKTQDGDENDPHL